jgi:hypothetical protein
MFNQKPMEVVMKKLLIALVILSSLVSCGKKNVAGSTSSLTSAITLNDSVAQNLGSQIDNSATTFGAGQAGYSGMTWNQVLAGTYYQPAKNLTYQYVTSAAQTANNCVEKTGWFGIKYWDCSPGSNNVSNPTITRTVVNNTVDLAVKRSELKAIINSATAGSLINSNNTIYTIRNASTGIVYTIDLRYPMQANPTSVQQANGQTEYFYMAI